MTDKFCKDCAHYVPEQTYPLQRAWTVASCKRVSFNLVTGARESHFNPHDERGLAERCGPDGKYWQAKGGK